MYSMTTAKYPDDWEKADQLVRSMDDGLRAFHILSDLDRDYEAFLHDKLSRAFFFRLKRQRIRVSREYVRRMAHNAAVVKLVAPRLRDSPDERVAETAKKAANLAAQLHKRCRIALAKLMVEYLFQALKLRI